MVKIPVLTGWRNRIQKQRFEQKLREEKLIKTVQSIVAGYLEKHQDYADVILEMAKNKELSKLMRLNDLNGFIDELESIKESAEGMDTRNISTTELEEKMGIIKICNEGLDFINDFIMVGKLLGKKSIDVSYSELFSMFLDEAKKSYDDFALPAYKKLSKALKGKTMTQKEIVTEIVRLGTSFSDSEIVLRVLEKFGYEYDLGTVEELIEDAKEDIRLEGFEKNMNSSKVVKKLSDFQNLNGREFETYLAEFFKLKGYTVVRTPLSGDQGADLIIAKNKEKTVVQAKKHSDKIGNDAVQEVIAAKNYYGVDKGLVVTNNSFTSSAIKLAVRSKIELWDGQKLKTQVSELENENGKYGHSKIVSVNIQKGKDTVNINPICPFCEEPMGKFTLDVKELGGKDIKCPNCSIKLKISRK